MIILCNVFSGESENNITSISALESIQNGEAETYHIEANERMQKLVGRKSNRINSFYVSTICIIF